MRRMICLLLLTSLSAQMLNAQSLNDNWIQHTRYTDPARPYAIVDVVFYNGLGLEDQTVSVAATPLSCSLVTPVAYDSALRPARTYLPYALTTSTASRQAAAHAAQKHYYESLYDDSAAYTTNVYEAAPTNRIVRQYAAGQVMLTADKATKIAYASNIGGSQYRPTVSSSGDLVISGYYAPKGLLVKKTEDADGCCSEVFTDRLGNVVLERRRPDSQSVADTYYVYDDFYCLRYVLPPTASRQLNNSSVTYASTSDFCRNYCYAYKYDARRRVVERRLPGADPEYLVYDNDDRIVGRQTAYDRAHGYWLTMRYTPTGMLKNVSRFVSDISRETFQQDFARYQNSGSGVEIYEYGIYPNLFGLKFQAIPGVAELSDKSDAVQGLKTWECFYSAGLDDGYYCVMRQFYYDYLGRVIQCAEHRSDDRVLRTSYKYDFTGNLLTCEEQSADVTKRTVYTYDLRGRRLSETTSLNGHPVATVAWAYDDLGRVAVRKYPQISLEETIGYNLQGFQTTQSSPLFSMQLRYHDPQYAATAPSYAGNISEWTFRQGPSAAEMTYGFAYDGLSRLTDTKQYVDGAPDDLFVEKGLSYDRNGNILTMQRTSGGVVSDSLAYTYAGNRLISLSGTTSCNYTYDAVGNMTHDGANNLDISYNRLNLIEKVTREGSTLAKYSYLSDSTKLSATNAAGEGLYYLGSLVYRKQGDSLTMESTDFSGGRIIAEQTGGGVAYAPLYYLTDHLGSVRVVLDAAGEVVERSDYYPFGLRWADAGNPVSENRYRYNGKEEQAFVNVPYIDYGARMYDPRFRLNWNGIDLLSEKYYSVSSYVFCAENPLRFNDIDGTKIVDAKGAVLYRDGQWTPAAKNTDSQKIGNAMMLSETGTAIWNQMDQSPELISMSISPESKTTDNGALVLGVAETHIGDGGKSVTITIFEGSINLYVSPDKKFEDEKKQEMMRSSTPEERIGAVGTHEGTHAIDDKVDNEREKRAVTNEKQYLKEVEQNSPVVTESKVRNI